MSSFFHKLYSTKFRKFLFGGFLLGFLATSCLALYIILVPPPPLWDKLDFSPLIMDNKGQLMRMALTEDEKYRERVTFKNIPENVRNAVMLYEDRYYYYHPGVNPFAILRAIKNTLIGTRRMGASTIAMQVARLRYNLVTKTIPGKFKQMILAMQLIWHYGHDEVLEAYFNLAPYGGNIEGIGAASRIYFQQPIENLTTSQALALTLIPQNPRARALKSLEKGRLAFDENFNQARDTLHADWNRNYPDQPVPEKAQPLRIYTTRNLPLIAPHLTTELLLENKKNPDKSYQINTTIDSSAQNLLETNVKNFVAHNSFYGIKNATAILLHWPSMEVRALVGSADFYNEQIDGQVDGTKAKRSPGSTLKPFIYALALDQGIIHPQTMLMDAPKSFGEYNPENFDKQFQGPIPAKDALRLSRNVPAISLATKLDPTLYNYLKRGNVDLKHEVGHYGLSLVLGGAELSMRELTTLYASLANGGVWQPLKFTNNNLNNQFGKPEQNQIQDDQSRPISLISPEAGLATLYMLQSYNPNFNSNKNALPYRYKTGTSNGFRDAWTIGIVGPYVLAIWLGNFDNRANSMLIGSRVAVPLYKQVATHLEYTYKLDDILARKYLETDLIEIETCRDTGDVQIELCDQRVKTWFIPGRSPIKNSNVYRKIWVDKESGLRLCGPSENAEEVIWEFWPSELYTLFSEAGLHKPLPPQFAEPCNSFTSIDENSIEIKSPNTGVIYHIGNNLNDTIPFTATTTAHANTLFWFVNEEYVGSSEPQNSFLWKMKIGEHNIQVIDDLGQSKKLKIKIEY